MIYLPAELHDEIFKFLSLRNQHFKKVLPKLGTIIIDITKRREWNIHRKQLSKAQEQRERERNQQEQRRLAKRKHDDDDADDDDDDLSDEKLEKRRMKREEMECKRQKEWREKQEEDAKRRMYNFLLGTGHVCAVNRGKLFYFHPLTPNQKFYL